MLRVVGILAFTFANEATAQVAGFPAFPEDGSHAEMARHCLTITTANDYASSFGAHVASMMSTNGTRIGWHFTVSRPSEELVALIGGAEAIEDALDTAAALRRYWESLGTTYFAAIFNGTAPYADAEGLALSAAFVRCLDWAATLPFTLHHPTERMDISYPGAPDLPSR
jgi:hypothetical protein